MSFLQAAADAARVRGAKARRAAFVGVPTSRYKTTGAAGGVLRAGRRAAARAARRDRRGRRHRTAGLGLQSAVAVQRRRPADSAAAAAAARQPRDRQRRLFPADAHRARRGTRRSTQTIAKARPACASSTSRSRNGSSRANRRSATRCCAAATPRSTAEIVGVIHDVKTNGLNAPAPDEIYYPMRQLGRPGMAVVARDDWRSGGAAERDSRRRRGGRQGPADLVLRDARDQPRAEPRRAAHRRVADRRLRRPRARAVGGRVCIRCSPTPCRSGRRRSASAWRSARSADRWSAWSCGADSSWWPSVSRSASPAAAGAARLIQTLLFDVRPLDPLVYGGVTVVFTLVATLACLLPSLRASRIDPLIALRSD